MTHARPSASCDSDHAKGNGKAVAHGCVRRGVEYHSPSTKHEDLACRRSPKGKGLEVQLERAWPMNAHMLGASFVGVAVGEASEVKPLLDHAASAAAMAAVDNLTKIAAGHQDREGAPIGAAHLRGDL